MYRRCVTEDPGKKEWRTMVEPYLRDRPFDLGKNALLVIDMQGFFLDPESHACVPDHETVKKNVSRLITAFRESRRPVIFTLHSHPKSGDLGGMGRWWRDPLMEDSPWSLPVFDPMGDEITVRKDRYDAFFRTDLEDVLRKTGTEEVFICGVMTHLCVETTARSAFVRDFDVTVIGDATGSKDEILHCSSLITMAHGFAVIRSTNDILKEVRLR
jgi:bifunctional isochorismate lyase/aryl carrier protein